MDTDRLLRQAEGLGIGNGIHLFSGIDTGGGQGELLGLLRLADAQGGKKAIKETHVHSSVTD